MTDRDRADQQYNLQRERAAEFEHDAQECEFTEMTADTQAIKTSQDATWTCSSCHADLHLSDTLWQDAENNPFCSTAVPDPVAEQYAAVGLIRPQFTTSRLHQPRSTWVHPIGPRES